LMIGENSKIGDESNAVKSVKVAKLFGLEVQVNWS